MNPNRTMSRDDFETVPGLRACAELIQSAMQEVRAAGGQHSTWWGTLDEDHVPETEKNKGADYQPFDWMIDERNIPWFTMWEYSWVLLTSDLIHLRAPQEVLSLGGAACALDIAIGLLGHSVTVIEKRDYSAEQANRNARLLNMAHRFRAHKYSIEHFDQPLRERKFDRVVSTNVLFLAGKPSRDALQRNLWRHVKVGGRCCFTFDHLNPNPERFVDSPETHFSWEFFQRVGEPFFDNGERYHDYYPDPHKGRYTAGALVLERVNKW